MKSTIVPSDRLTLSERFVVVAIRWTFLAFGLIVIGMLLMFPMVVGGILAVLFGVEVQRRKRLRRRTSGVFGIAHFATTDEIRAAGLTGQCDGLILGIIPWRLFRDRVPIAFKILRTPFRDVATIRSLLTGLVVRWNSAISSEMNCLIRLPSTDKYAHIACYLPTGVGKTWRVVIPNLLGNSENAFVFDPSGETVRETADFRRTRFGHEVRVIDPFGVCGGRYTDRLNVLDLVRPEDPACFEYCNSLGHALVVEKEGSHHDPFFHSSTVFATAFLIHAIMLMAKEGMRTLPGLGELINAEQFQKIGHANAGHPDTALRRRAQQMLNFQGKTLQSVLACMTAEHGWMDTPAFADVLSASTFSVKHLYERKMTIYLVIPGHRAIESRPFVRTLLTALLFAGFEAGPDIRRPAVRFYLDEAATLGKLDILMTLYTQGRKFGLRSANFFQSVAQVAEITGSPEKVQTFRANMAGELFKAKDYQTAKEVSDWIGQTTLQTVSESWQEGRSGGWSSSSGQHPSNGWSGGWNGGSGTTVNETGQSAIRPEEVLQLGEREAIFVAAGTAPVKLNILAAEDVAQCANSDANRKSYLKRVRLRALGFLFVAPASLVIGFTWIYGGYVVFEREHLSVNRTVESERPTNRARPSMYGSSPTTGRVGRLNHSARQSGNSLRGSANGRSGQRSYRPQGER